MSITEILLIIVGFGLIIAGYLIPAGKDIDEEQQRLIDEAVNESVRRALENSKNKIEDMIDDSMEDSINKTERAIERLTNEKISAISEYSDTVINDIHKNHDEVVFMYDMLNDKHKNLTTTVSEVTKKADEAKQTVLDAQITAHEAEEAAERFKELENKTNVSDKIRANSDEVHISEVRARQAKALENKVQEKLNRLIRPDITEGDEDVDKNGDSYDERMLINEMLINGESPKKNNYSKLEQEVSKTETPVSKDTNIEDKLDKEFKALQDLPVVHVLEEELAENIKGYLDEDDDVAALTGNRRVVTPQKNEENHSSDKVVNLSEAKEEVLKNKVVTPDEDNDLDLDPSAQNKQILEMHKAGKSNMVIARELGLGIGEVRLVIDLSNKHKRAR